MNRITAGARITHRTGPRPFTRAVRSPRVRYTSARARPLPIRVSAISKDGMRASQASTYIWREIGACWYQFQLCSRVRASQLPQRNATSARTKRRSEPRLTAAMGTSRRARRSTNSSGRRWPLYKPKQMSAASLATAIVTHAISRDLTPLSIVRKSIKEKRGRIDGKPQSLRSVWQTASARDNSGP